MIASLPARIASDHATNERRRLYTENRAYYAGQHTINARRSPGTKATPRNLTALFTDTITDHLGKAAVSFGVGSPADQVDEYVLASLAAEDSEILDYDTEIAASVDGHAAWKITYDDQQRRPRVARVAPETLWMQGAADNPLDITTVAQRYKVTREDFPILFPGTLALGARDAWITEEWTAARWRVWLDEALAFEQPNPYGFIPYVDYPNYRNPGEYWGRGDGERIRPLQDRLNYASADLDDLMALMGQVVVLEGITDAGDLSWRPGAFWTLPEDAKAYVLDLLGEGGVTGRLEYIEKLRNLTHDIGRVPTSVLGAASTRNLSGIALQTELGPLLRLVARKRLTRSAALRRRAQLIAALGSQFDGLPDASHLPVTVSWTEALPSDRADELANAEAEARLGRDPEAILRTIGIEDPAAELAARIDWTKRGLPGATPNGTGKRTDQPDAVGP